MQQDPSCARLALYGTVPGWRSGSWPKSSRAPHHSPHQQGCYQITNHHIQPLTQPPGKQMPPPDDWDLAHPPDSEAATPEPVGFHQILSPTASPRCGRRPQSWHCPELARGDTVCLVWGSLLPRTDRDALKSQQFLQKH